MSIVKNLEAALKAAKALEALGKASPELLYHVVVATASPAPKSVLAVTPTALPASKQVPVVSSAPAVSPAPKPVVTALPRELKQFNLENAKKTWMGQLGGIARGGNAPWGTVQATATRLFKEGVKLTLEEWQTLFSAMKAASQNKNYILSNTVVNTKSFCDEVPMDPLREYVFGENGAMTMTMADLSECKVSMEPRHVAKVHVLLSMIDLLDRSTEGGISDEEVEKVEKLEVILDQLNAPRSVFDKIDTILAVNRSATVTVASNGARIIGDLSSVVKKTC